MSIFRQSDPIETLQRLRQRFVLVLSAVTIVGELGLPIIPLIDGRNPFELFQGGLWLLIGVTLLLNIIAFVMARQGFLGPAVVALCTSVTVMAFFLSSVAPPDIPPGLYLFVFGTALVTTALLANNWGVALVLGALILRVVLSAAGDIQAQAPEEPVGPLIVNAAIQSFLLVLMTAVVRSFVAVSERTTQLAKRTADRLRTTAEVGRLTAGLLDLSDLLARATEYIRDGFAFYHVQVFLTDENARTATLAASTGDIGQRLLQDRFSVNAGDGTLIGRMLQTGEPVFNHDVDDDFERLPLLTSTRSELVLPILEANRIVGALDVHSFTPDAFHANDVQALQIAANQLATALRNARLFEAQTKSASENKRLFLEAETRLRETQRLNQQLTKEAWTEFLEERREVSGLTYENDLLTVEHQWSDAQIQAVTRRTPITRQQDGRQIIAVPITLRGEVLGAIEVEPSEPMREGDTLEMMRSVAERLATTLENTRLLEQSQADTAQKERVSEIIAQFQTVTTIDELLRLSLTQLSQTLGAERSSVRIAMLRTPALTEPSSNGNHDASESRED